MNTTQEQAAALTSSTEVRHPGQRLPALSKRGVVGVLLLLFSLHTFYDAIFVSKEQKFEDLRRSIRAQAVGATNANWDRLHTGEQLALAVFWGVAGLALIRWGVRVGQKRRSEISGHIASAETVGPILFCQKKNDVKVIVAIAALTLVIMMGIFGSMEPGILNPLNWVSMAQDLIHDCCKEVRHFLYLYVF